MPPPKIYPGQKITEEKLHRAKQLRREMTEAEALLWNELRANKLGVHFRRQQIIAGFIVDFYCHSASLVIEVDGEIHQESGQQAEDGRRAAELTKMGLRLARVSNAEVLADMAGVLTWIRSLVEE